MIHDVEDALQPANVLLSVLPYSPTGDRLPYDVSAYLPKTALAPIY